MEKNMKCLFKTKQPYQHRGKNGRYFLKAMRHTCMDYMKKSAEYRTLCHEQGFFPGKLQTMKDLQCMPMIPTAYLKRNDISVPHAHAVEVTSSGTGGKVSRVSYSLAGPISWI